MFDPIRFLPRTPIEQLEILWNYRFPMLRGIPEVWAPITKAVLPNVVEDVYAISTYGRCLNIQTGYELEQRIGGAGYYRFNLVRDDIPSHSTRPYAAHRLVLMTFMPVYDMENLQVNHIDEIKSHNWFWNLEWLTPSENRRYSIDLGRIRLYGEDNPISRLSSSDADKVGYLLSNTNKSIVEIANEVGNGCSPGDVLSIANGITHLSVYSAYKLQYCKRQPNAVNESIIHSICKFIQDYMISNKIEDNFKDESKFFDFVAVSCGLPYNHSSRKLVRRLFYRINYKEICDQYIY